MGLYDREYVRDHEPGIHLAGPQTATTLVILITVAAYLIQWVAPQLTDYLALDSAWYQRPWTAYQLLTYGLVHSLGGEPGEPGVLHILGNMFLVWMFGYEVERRYGRDRFLIFYVTAIVFAGLVWTASEALAGGRSAAIGASGAATAVVILYALNFPNRTIYFNLLIPIPTWLFGLFVVLSDASGAMGHSGNVAYTAHLGGAAFALLFFQTGWLPGGAAWQRLKSLAPSSKPRLRVHEPEDDEDSSSQVDAILRKIADQGQDSLTRRERQVLENASRRLREKRQ